MDVKKLNEALTSLKKNMQEDEDFMAKALKKLPKFSQNMAKEHGQIFAEMDAIDEITTPFKQTIYRVSIGKSHKMYFSEMGYYLGAEDEGLKDKEWQSKLSTYSLMGKACKIKRVL